MCYHNLLIKSYNLTQKIYTFRKNALLKVKIYLNLNETINFYRWCELTRQNMKNIINCSFPSLEIIIQISAQ